MTFGLVGLSERQVHEFRAPLPELRLVGRRTSWLNGWSKADETKRNLRYGGELEGAAMTFAEPEAEVSATTFCVRRHGRDTDAVKAHKSCGSRTAVSPVCSPMVNWRGVLRELTENNRSQLLTPRRRHGLGPLGTVKQLPRAGSGMPLDLSRNRVGGVAQSG